MELRQLQYFVKVARMQHVTKAAEELHIAQSAVSRQIRQLEQELEVELFDHRGRNVQLTPAGQLFLSRVEELLADLERAVAEVREFSDPEKGVIRLGFPHSLGVHLVPRAVAAFRKKHPGVRFIFRQGMYPSLIKDVLEKEVDLALISPFPGSDEKLTGEVVLTEELLAILPEHHPLAKEESIELSQLKDEEFVLFSPGFSLRPIVVNACLSAGFKPKIAFEGDEVETIRGLVAAGMGVSLLPEMALAGSGVMMPAKVPVSDPPVSRTIGLIHRAGQKLPNVAEMFRRFLVAYFRERRTDNGTGGAPAGKPI